MMAQAPTNQLGWPMKMKLLSSIMEDPPCQRITDKSWKTSGKRQGPSVTCGIQKNVLHMDGHFFGEGEQERGEVKLMLDAQKKRMDWDRKRTEKKLQIEREKIELEKQEATIKWELEKANIFAEIEFEKKRLQLAWDAEGAKIMLADKTLLDEHAKWLARKEINERKEYEAAMGAAAAAEHAAKMQDAGGTGHKDGLGAGGMDGVRRVIQSAREASVTLGH